MNVVSLYIYTSSEVDTTLNITNDFISRVASDGGTFENNTCLLSQLNSIGGFSAITSNSKRLDLFNDEKISVTSAVSNFNDLGKIFTDFSQSFTIPASKNNNKILSHWYESSLDNGYDHRKRYDAYIEIDYLLYKKGNIQLEKANKKNGFIESYTITFYGNLTQLKDKFKDDKLNKIDFSALNHTYNSTNIINRINPTSSFLVNYPLIGSQRKFYYKEGTSSQDDYTNPDANMPDAAGIQPNSIMQSPMQVNQLKAIAAFGGKKVARTLRKKRRNKKNSKKRKVCRNTKKINKKKSYKKRNN